MAEMIISYHFFRSDNAKDSIDNVCRDLLQKALPQVSQLPTKVVDYHQKYGRSVRTPTEKLWEVLIAAKTPLTSVYIVLDGLDEFHAFTKLFQYLRRLTEARIKVFIASRDLPTIQSQLCDNPGGIAAVAIEVEAIEGDIRKYVEARLEADCVVDQHDIPIDVRSELFGSILKNANGS